MYLYVYVYVMHVYMNMYIHFQTWHGNNRQKNMLRGCLGLDLASWKAKPLGRCLLDSFLQKVREKCGLDTSFGQANIKHYRKDSCNPLDLAKMYKIFADGSKTRRVGRGASDRFRVATLPRPKPDHEGKAMPSWHILTTHDWEFFVYTMGTTPPSSAIPPIKMVTGGWCLEASTAGMAFASRNSGCPSISTTTGRRCWRGLTRLDSAWRHGPSYGPTGGWRSSNSDPFWILLGHYWPIVALWINII